MTAKKEAVKKREAGPKKETHHRSRLYDSFQEEIANTYFKTSPSGRKAPKKRRIPKAPWIVAACAACVAAAIFISKSSFDIKVRVLNGTPFITSDGSALPDAGARFFVKGGSPDRDLVAKAFFVADARASSAMSEREVTLTNAKSQGWASFVVELKEPADLTKNNIRYSAKGQGGSEKIVPIVTDSQNRSFRISDAAITTLSDSWRTYIVDFRPVRGDIDLKNIAAIKFEFGTETAGNPASAAIFLKDVSAVKSRRIKWL